MKGQRFFSPRHRLFAYLLMAQERNDHIARESASEGLLRRYELETRQFKKTVLAAKRRAKVSDMDVKLIPMIHQFRAGKI